MTAIIRVVNNQITVSAATAAMLAAILLPQVALAQTAQGLAEAARDLSQGHANDAAMVSGVDTAKRASVATAQSQDLAAAIQTIVTDAFSPTYADLDSLAGGARYVRASYAEISSLPALAYWRHSTDRYLPDGTTDATNGGYFVLSEPVVSPLMFGAKGDGSTDDTAAVDAALELERPIDLLGRSYVVTGLTPSISTLRMRNGTLKLADNCDVALLAPVGEDIVADIEGVTFDGNHQGQAIYVNYTTVFEAVKSARIVGCRFPNGSGSVLALLSVKQGAVVEGNVFWAGKPHTGIANDNTVYFFARVDPAYQTEEPQFVRVAGNTFIGLATGGVGQPAVGYGVAGVALSSNTASSALSGHKVTITDNIFYCCGQTALSNRVGAITLYRRAPFSRIANNIVLFGDERGIDVQASDNVTVTGNIVYQTKGDGISTAVRTDSGTTKSSARPVITGNTVIGDGVAVGSAGLLFAGIRCAGSDTVAGATDLIVSDNMVSGYPQSLVVTGYLGSLKIADNILDTGTSTFTAVNQRPVTILSDTSSTTPEAGRLSFTGNQISNMAGQTVIRGFTLAVIVADNSWGAMATAAAALSLTYCSGAVSVTGNVFQNTGAASRIEQCTGTLLWSGNSVLNSNTVIRAADFRNNTADILVANNILKTVGATEAFNFNTCTGRNQLANNVAPSGTTVGTTGSTVTQANNLFS